MWIFIAAVLSNLKISSFILRIINLVIYFELCNTFGHFILSTVCMIVLSK